MQYYLRLAVEKLFSAYAEVFPVSEASWSVLIPFLCLRRGVSYDPIAEFTWSRFSLPTQRCFHFFEHRFLDVQLFSAYAEVFLRSCLDLSGFPAFLCLRRGVSRYSEKVRDYSAFSLPTQRCFLRPHGSQSERPLFSAYAEVFLSSTALSPSTGTFLCLRRGVSQAFDQPITPPGFSLPTQRCF